MTETVVTPPAAVDPALAARVEELAAKIAKTADADTKAFLETVHKTGEATLAQLKAVSERLEAAEKKVAAGEAAAVEAAKKTALKDAAKLAGAFDVGDVLALVNLAEVKIEDGAANVAELVEGLKKSKPHLFKAAATTTTTTTAPAPKPGDLTPKNAKDMTEAERDAKLAELGINPKSIRRR